MKTTYLFIFKDTEVKLWGLSGRERLTRIFQKYDNVEFVADASQIPAGASVLLLRADFLFDTRLIQALVQLQHDIVLLASYSDEIVAVRGDAINFNKLVDEITGESESSLLAGMKKKMPEDLVNAYDPKLLKYDPPEILAINQENKKYLENELFDGSYKGVTDFITKWLWPIPARHAVRMCVHYKIQPNDVTILSLVLAILTGLAFWEGYLLAGLVMGWFMTFLDTVDGKLARVTINSSKLGDILDHGLDIIHPPFWYFAWGMGIVEMWTSSVSVLLLCWIILIAYIGGRICEGAFELWIAPFRLFLWQPWDSYNRLITARRNPNLVILTLSLFSGRPDIGLWTMVIWHCISTFVLMARLFIAHKQKNEVGELTPWLNNIDPVRDRHRLDVRLFTRISKSTSVTNV